MPQYKYTRNDLKGTITLKGWPCETCGGTEFDIHSKGYNKHRGFGDPCVLVCMRCKKNHNTRHGKLMDLRFRVTGHIHAQPALCPICGVGVDEPPTSPECLGQ
jgi:hypothetical protein